MPVFGSLSHSSIISAQFPPDKVKAPLEGDAATAVEEAWRCWLVGVVSGTDDCSADDASGTAAPKLRDMAVVVSVGSTAAVVDADKAYEPILAVCRDPTAVSLNEREWRSIDDGLTSAAGLDAAAGGILLSSCCGGGAALTTWPSYGW